MIKFRRKLKGIIKDFIWKVITNWLNRISSKYKVLCNSVGSFPEAIAILKRLKIFRNKIKQIKMILFNCWQLYWIVNSLVNEFCFFPNLYRWLIQWISLVLFLTEESILLIASVYVLCFILLGILGILLGFFIYVFGWWQEIYILLLLFLSLDLSKFLESSKIEDLSAQVFEPINFPPPKLPKVFMEEFIEKPQIPSLFDDSYVSIEVDYLIEEPITPPVFKFELFIFYENIREKLSS